MRTWVLLLAVAACGDVVKKNSDAGGGDDDGGMTGDAAPVTGPITVHVRSSDGTPDLAASVLVMTDDGQVVHDGLVDATGKITVDLTGRGWVTARSVREGGTARDVRMTSVLGVEPNDEIFIGPPRQPQDNTTVSSNRNFQFTRNGNSEHVFYVPCGNRFFSSTNTATTGQMPIIDACVPPTFSFLGVATLGADKYFAYVPNQVRSATTTIVVPTPWTRMSTVNAQFTNVPSGMEYFSGTRYTLLDDVPTAQEQYGVANPVGGGSFTMPFPYAPNVGSGARFSFALGNQTTGERQWVNIRTSTATASVAFDYSMLDLPRLLSVPTQTPEGASWTETAGTFDPDIRLVRWTGHMMDGATTVDIHWDVIDGEQGTSLTLPTLPDSYADYDPRKLTGYTTAGDNWVYYVDCDMITTYKAGRALNRNLINTFIDFKGAIGADYRCRISESAYNDPI